MTPSTKVQAAALLRLVAELVREDRGAFVTACMQLAVTDEVLELAWPVYAGSRVDGRPRRRVLLDGAAVLEREAANGVAV